jgi:hypothetical protein
MKLSDDACLYLAQRICYQLEVQGLAKIDPGVNVEQKTANIKKAVEMVAGMIRNAR